MNVIRNAWPMVIALVFWLLIASSARAQNIEVYTVYTLVPYAGEMPSEIKQELAKQMGHTITWEKCGKYFSIGESRRGKFLHFFFKGEPENGYVSVVSVAVSTRLISTAKNGTETVPVVMIEWLGQRIEDTRYYFTAQVLGDVSRCLAKGMRI